MVKALFDTNILIDYLNAIPEARNELGLYQETSISIITWMEVMVGAEPELETPTRNFLSRFTILGIDEKPSERSVFAGRIGLNCRMR
jgi:predicted nucleic acid-binding protein